MHLPTYFKVLLLAALIGLVGLAQASPLPGRQASNITSRGEYELYTGDGWKWPSTDSWVNFDTMWQNNLGLLHTSCTQYGQANNSPEEVSDMHTAILIEATSSGVDSRFILATILQESNGCVRVPTSFGGVVNPGLMQTHNGEGTCYHTSPCPKRMINLMVHDGTSGTVDGDGLVQCISQAYNAGATGATAIYRAARIYNTGSYSPGTDLGTPAWGTSCYSTDIANRLTGWSGLQSPCTLPNPSH